VSPSGKATDFDSVIRRFESSHPSFYQKRIMTVQIQFFEGISETTLPLIKLTKSRNGKTGTATFIFIEPSSFEFLSYQKHTIHGMFLLWETKKISSTDIKMVFKNGKPFLIKTIFIFKNSNEWFNFLNFMSYYTKETGLSFAEKNNSS
jgi:photosystem II protein